MNIFKSLREKITNRKADRLDAEAFQLLKDRNTNRNIVPKFILNEEAIKKILEETH